MVKKKKNFKYWIGRIHLWLGLSSGLVVLIVSLTGCIFVFQKEISELVYRDKLFVTPPANAQTLPVSTLLKNAQSAMGDSIVIRNFTAYKQPDKAWEFMAFKGGDPNALTFYGSVAYYQSVHLNPYTGAVTGKTDYMKEFFITVKYLHWSLLLNTPYGQPIVGYATLIFVVMLISGMILWWPKKWNRANRQKSFRIKWNANFKRKNYDLHNVLGFYTLIPALLIALTGMVWAFKWWQATVYVAASGSTKAPEQVKVISAKPENFTPGGTDPLDIAYADALKRMPDADRIAVLSPATPEAPIRINGYRGKETYHDRDELFFDQYSAQFLKRRNDSEKNAGEQLIEANYDIHIGAIAGLPGKILAFFASLICASLPVTGFMVWWGKKFKGKKKKPVVAGEAKLFIEEAVGV